MLSEVWTAAKANPAALSAIAASLSALVAVLSSPVSIFAVFFTHKLTSRRALREKAWDLRRACYSRLVAEMTNIIWVIDAADRYIEEDAQRYFAGREPDNDPFSRHARKLTKHIGALRKIYAEENLVFSAPLKKIIDDFLRSLAEGDYDSDPPDQHKHFASLCRETLPKLEDQAKREIAI